MKKIFLYFISLFIIGSLFVNAQFASCDTSTTATNTSFYAVNISDTNTITFGNDEQFSSFLNITSISTFVLENYCQNTTVNNQSGINLYWAEIDGTNNNNVSVFNSTAGLAVLASGNYTINYTIGNITWSNIHPTVWNGTEVSVCYNKTFTAYETDLVSLGLGYSENTGTTYGSSKTWQLLNNSNEQSWSTYYDYTSRTCNARDSCLQTQQTVFAGFGLLAVGIIALAAFLIIKFDLISSAAMPTVIGSIALGVVLMVGYIVISNVGQSICQAAVG